MLTFFDSNCMLGGFRNAPRPVRTAGELRQRMARHHIGRALVCHAPYGPALDNELLLEAIGDASDLLPVALVAPWETSRERLTARTREILSSRACAIRMFPAAQHFDFSPERLGDVMGIASERRLPLIVDADQLGGLGSLAGMLQAYPAVPFVLARTGCAQNRAIYELLDRHANFYVETSLFRAFEGIEDLAARFGAGRVLFGSGMPLLDPGSAVARLVYAGLEQQDRERIAGGNLAALIADVRR